MPKLPVSSLLPPLVRRVGQTTKKGGGGCSREQAQQTLTNKLKLYL